MNFKILNISHFTKLIILGLTINICGATGLIEGSGGDSRSIFDKSDDEDLRPNQPVAENLTTDAPRITTNLSRNKSGTDFSQKFPISVNTKYNNANQVNSQSSDQELQPSPDTLEGSGVHPGLGIENYPVQSPRTIVREPEPSSIRPPVNDSPRNDPVLPCDATKSSYRFHPPSCWRSNNKLYSRLQCVHPVKPNQLKECSCVRAGTGEPVTPLKENYIGNCSIAVISVNVTFYINNRATDVRSKRAAPTLITPNSQLFLTLSSRYENSLRSLLRVTYGYQQVKTKSIWRVKKNVVLVEGMVLSVGHDSVSDVTDVIRSRIDEGEMNSLLIIGQRSHVKLVRLVSGEVPYQPLDLIPDANLYPESQSKVSSESVSDPDNDDKSNYSPSKTSKNYSKESSYKLLTQPGIIAAMIGGGLVGLLLTILLLLFLIYRVRKRDEGSYALDEPKKLLKYNMYQRTPDREFYA